MSTCRHDVAGSSKILVWTSTRTSRSPARLWLRAMSGGGRIDPASKITEREDRGPRTQWGHAYSGGETVNWVLPVPAVLELQWGHAYSGVET